MRYLRFMTFCGGLLVSSLLAFNGSAQSQDVELRINAKQCFQGAVYDPPNMWIRVFDASKVGNLVEEYREFRRRWDPANAASVDKAMDVYNDLYRRLQTTPALYRSKDPVSTPRVVRVPFAKRYVIFALGFDESALTSIAERELEPRVGVQNDVALVFPSE